VQGKCFAIATGEIVLMKCATCGQRIDHLKQMDSFYLSMTKRFTRLEKIMHIMQHHYGITYKQLRMKRRTYGLAQQRHIFCKLAGEFTEASYPMIGRFINRDHTTVMNSVDVKLDTDYSKIYEDLRERVMQSEEDAAFLETA